MPLRDLEDIQLLFRGLEGAFAGIGMTAFSRVVPAYFLRTYSILCLRNTLDLPIVKRKTAVLCIEEAQGRTVRDENWSSAHVAAQREAVEFLGRLPRPVYLFPYQSYPELEALALRHGWRCMANPAALRLRVGRRPFFREMLKELDLPLIPGGIHPVSELRARTYRDWTSQLGPRLVVQLPDLGQGGGRGTFFVDTAGQYEDLKLRLAADVWRGKPLGTVSVHRRMEGSPASMTLCLTRHGVLRGPLQRQLIDLPYCRGLAENGIFCGNVWGEGMWSSAVMKSAQTLGDVIGGHLRALGYRGILGVDFLASEETGRVYPLEINPRLTGVFPMYSLLCLERGIPPFEAFHLLEFAGVPYRVDVHEMNERHGTSKTASHILLFLLDPRRRPADQALKAGLYRFDPETKACTFVQEALGYGETHGEFDFVLGDGPPEILGTEYPSKDPLYRLCRLLFSSSAWDRGGSLPDWVTRVIEWVYGRLIREEKS